MDILTYILAKNYADTAALKTEVTDETIQRIVNSGMQTLTNLKNNATTAASQAEAAAASAAESAASVLSDENIEALTREVLARVTDAEEVAY